MATNTTQLFEDIRNRHKLPALGGVVVKDGKICERVAVGVRKSGEPNLLTTNDQFHIGSCTKSMTATLAAILIDEGKLAWDTTIAQVFPELKGQMDKQYESVTIEQLLTHRGGVPGQPPKLAWIEAWTETGTPMEQRYRFVKAVLRKKPQAAPGTSWIYSNQGYAIAGAMLEKLTSTPWEKLISNRLFRPLHMRSSGFGPPGAMDKVEQPWGHMRSFGRIKANQTDNPPAIGPAGTVHCSLDDLARYAMFHLHGEREASLLKAETLRKLHTPPEGGDYACGWGCGQHPAAGKVLTHAGSNGSWYVFIWLAIEKNVAIIIGTNLGGDRAEQATIEAARAMINKWLPNEKK